ncbi:MAG TPA: DUF6445 family protein [Kofleriaceae bacterium]|nr:DUF6445 family protein [Kofleriaceae bacterium]
MKRPPGASRPARASGELRHAFRLSSRPIINVLEVADCSLVVIDNLYADPLAVRDLALSLDYTVRRASYPGPEAALWVPGMPLCPFLGDVLSRDAKTEVVPVRSGSHRPIPREHRFRAARSRRLPTPRGYIHPRDVAVFSAFSHPEGIRNEPHIDEALKPQLAATVYLNPPEQCRGGTAFYRHRKTGLLAMPLLSDPRLEDVIETHGYASAADLMKDVVGRTGRRSGGGRDWIRRWDVVALVKMRFNRLVLHAGNLLHGPIMGRADFGRTLETTRLTQNLFLEAVPSTPRIGKRSPRAKGARPAGTGMWADLEDVSV